MSITSNIANVASRLTTGEVVSNLNADLLDGQSGSYYTGISSSGFDQANTAATIAQAAFVQANTGTIQAQSAFSQANTGTTQVQAAFSQANNAYAQANTGTTQAQAAFSQANTGSTVAFASFSQANNAYAQANTGTTQAQAAFSQANNAYAQANTGTTQAQAAFSTANGAYSTANTKFPSTGGTISGDVRIGGSLQIDANLIVSGNVTTINANNLSIVDNMIYLNHDANVANPDIGIAAAYNDGTYHHTGFFRDATDGVWKIFDNYRPEPDASIYIDTSNSTFRIADFQANNITANSIILGTDFKLPVGNTAQRPTASSGKLYYNNETGKFEGYGTVWGSIGGGALISDTAPANPASGDLWWNSLDGKTYIYYGNVWVQAQPGGEGQYLPLTGGTVTGNITSTGNLTANNIIASNNVTYSGTLTGVTGTYSGTVTANNIVSSNNVTYSGTLTGGTGIVNIGSGQIYKDSSGNVGIGTASPGAKLDVRATSFTPASTNAATIIEDKSAWSQGLQFYLNNAGLYASSRPSGGLGAANSTELWLTGGSLVTNNTQAASGITAYATSASIYRCGSGAHYWYGDTGLTAGSTYTQTQRMTLDASGNLGLGVTPNTWYSGYTALEFKNYGAITSRAASNSMEILTNAYRNASANYVYKQSGTAQILEMANGAYNFYIASSGTAGATFTPTQAMTLDASGCLGVGPGGTSPSSYGWITAIGSPITRPLAALYSNTASDNAYPCIQIGKYANDSTTANIYVRFFYNNLTNGGGQINANGAGAAAFGSFSDARLKENIEDLPPQLDSILALRPTEFDYKDGSGHQIGFIAQEMEEVYPDCIGEGADGMKTITGWSKTEARLVKAIQELSAELNELKQRIK